MNDILFGNNNKAIIKNLANRSFRSNRMRNVIAVIAIALTTFLFTSVLTIGMGTKGTLEYSMAKKMCIRDRLYAMGIFQSGNNSKMGHGYLVLYTPTWGIVVFCQRPRFVF